jgi:hypothetical protein
MNVVTLNPNPTMDDALAVLDALRRDVEGGKVVAFFVAGISPTDETIAYASAVKPVSRLRLQGAMGQALHDMQIGTI